MFTWQLRHSLQSQVFGLVLSMTTCFDHLVLITDILSDVFVDHILDDVFLSIQYDVSQFTEVLNNLLMLKVCNNEDLIQVVWTTAFFRNVGFYQKLGVLDELFNKWVDDSVVLFAAL